MTIFYSLKWCATQGGGSGGISTPYESNGTFSVIEFVDKIKLVRTQWWHSPFLLPCMNPWGDIHEDVLLKRKDLGLAMVCV